MSGARQTAVIFSLLSCTLLILCVPLCAEPKSASAAVFAQGCDAFKNGDWTAAMMLLRRATVDNKYDTEATRYMMIMAEMNGGAADAAVADCNAFSVKFPDSQYLSIVQYQKGRALYQNGEYDKCAMCLSDFCHQYPTSELYPAALFWIAECFFATAHYDEARALYTRIVEEFPKDGKASEARYRLETIASREREEKLLYLLHKTGEEYLTAKEDYDKALHLYSSEASSRGMDERTLNELKRRNDALEKELNDLRAKAAAEAAAGSKLKPGGDGEDWTEEIRKLKAKAAQTQQMLTEVESKEGK